MKTAQSWLDTMSPAGRAAAKKYVEGWKISGPILEQLRREELKKVDAYKSLQSLSGFFDFSVSPYRPEPTSGLIQQQAWFKKSKRD